MTDGPLRTLRFKPDASTRKRLFVPDSLSHPAKGHLGLWAELIQLYSKPGDMVLDPMAGIGTSLIAALMGRNVICVELEQHFVEPMRRSWEKMRQHPMLGYQMGQAVILRGDARMLPLPDASVDVETLSPPYEGTNDEDRRFGGIRDPTANKSGSMGRMALRYTRKPVDAIITSPPFQDQEPNHLGGDTDFSQVGGIGHASVIHYGIGENIGNMRNAVYWKAMRHVYAECWRVLKPGGIMALVLKGFTRDGKYVDLPGQTEALLLEAGWLPHDHWRRELWSLSFWRILQKQRDPAAWDDRLMYEEVLAFRKPAGDGKGIDAVITSPPYEGTHVADITTGRIGDNPEPPWRQTAGDGYSRPEPNLHLGRKGYV